MPVTLAYFIQRLRNNTLQNIGGDYFEDIDWVYQINTALIFFFNYMNSNGPWYFANVYEEITNANPAGGITFETTHTIGRVFKVIDTVIGKEIEQNNVAANYNGSKQSYRFSITGGNEITIDNPVKTIGVRYQRMPKRHNYTNLEEQLDIPLQAIGILEFFVLRRIMPIHLEQGASLANNYYAQGEKSLVAYAQNIGYTNKMAGIITKDQFTNEQSPRTNGTIF